MNKKILLIAWYIAWIAIALKYKNKDKESNKKFSEEFLDIHKALFNEVKNSPKTKDFLNKLDSKITSFKKDWKKILESMPDKSKESLEKAKQKLEEIYNNKQEYLEKAKIKAKDFIEDNKIRKEIFSDMKDILNKKYKSFLNKIEN